MNLLELIQTYISTRQTKGPQEALHLLIDMGADPALIAHIMRIPETFIHVVTLEKEDTVVREVRDENGTLKYSMCAHLNGDYSSESDEVQFEGWIDTPTSKMVVVISPGYSSIERVFHELEQQYKLR